MEKLSIIVFSVLFSISMPDFLFTSSGVAHWLYHKTGTQRHKDSAVDKPKLSLVRFIVHFAFFIISMLSFGVFRHVNVILSFAIFLSSCSSGQLHIIING
jgi:hypothetical protein